MTKSGIKNILVTVVVPVYNVSRYLGQCIDSIIAQSHRNLEIILIDDGSTDGSGKICDDYAERDSRIRVIHKTNGGLSSARNSGLDVATGDWISFVDSDDYIEEDMIQTLLEKCIMNEGHLAVSGLRAFDDETGHTISNYSPHDEVVPSEKLIELMTLKNGPMFSVCNKFYHKSLWDRIRFPEGRCWEDVATNHLVIDNVEKVILVDKILYNYRKRQDSISTRDSLRRFDDFEKSTGEFLEWAILFHPNLKNVATACYVRVLLYVMSNSAICGDREYYRAIRKKLIYCIKNRGMGGKSLDGMDRVKVYFVWLNLFYDLYGVLIKMRKGRRFVMDRFVMRKGNLM